MESISRRAAEPDGDARRPGDDYDISDDEGSSGSENDKQPVELDDAAQVNVPKLTEHYSNP